MPAAQQDFLIEQGATFSTSLSFNQPEDQYGNPGEPIDISSWTFNGSIRANYSSQIDLQNFTFTLGPPVTWNNETYYNQIIISLTSTQTSALPVRPTQNYQITPTYLCYDIFATVPGSPSSSVMKILVGSVNLVPQVTQGV